MPQTRPIKVRLNAVIVTVTDRAPRVLTISGPAVDRDALPSGALDADKDRTVELGLRRLVRQQTGVELGYVEQLYTFGDRGRDPRERVISIAYLALVRASPLPGRSDIAWRNCYDLLPWEDWRSGRPSQLDSRILPPLRPWIETSPERRERADITFGLGGSPWDAARALERYELLYELGLAAEHHFDLGQTPPADITPLGRPMMLDHRRMVSTALSRVRGKLSYRPVVFELLPDRFTLSGLQRVVEALAGRELHTSNFRRLVEKGRLVESTGTFETRTGGRPAALFRFRRDVLRERPAPGVGLPGAR